MNLDFDVGSLLDTLGPLLLAFALAFPVGWERGRGRSSIGFRTLPVVAMASCGFALLARDLVGANAESQTRLLQGLMGGIGFIGGGAILKDNGSVKGLVTAASVWNVAAIGVSVAYERIEIALTLSVLNLAVLIFLTPLGEELEENDPPS